MAKIRIHEIAKELGYDSKEVKIKQGNKYINGLELYERKQF